MKKLEYSNREYYVDIHIHLLLDKKSKPDWFEIRYILSSAAKAGLNAICIAEHRESKYYRELMCELFLENKLGGKQCNGAISFDSGLTVYPAAEIQLRNGSNIGIHTEIQTLLNLESEPGFYSLDSLYSYLTSGKKSFAMVAHHIYWKGKQYSDHSHLAKYVNVLEVPAKDSLESDKYFSLSDKLNIPTAGGSDAHTFIQVGACKTRMLVNSILSHASFIEELINGRCEAKIHLSAQQLVDLSNIYRKKMLISN